jgi:Sugar (and other) transporter
MHKASWATLRVMYYTPTIQFSGVAPQVMYYTPAILQLAGVTDKRTALLVALIPAAVNAGGTLVGMAAIDRCGRRWGALLRPAGPCP